LESEDGLNIFHFDENYEENEKKYQEIREEILGEDVVDVLEGRAEAGGGEEGEEEGEEGAANGEAVTSAQGNEGAIHDVTEQDLINLRRTIYLTIMSSVDFNECAHKLLKIKLQPGQVHRTTTITTTTAHSLVVEFCF
jgi:pre-mRNA-splicing factor CWC22